MAVPVTIWRNTNGLGEYVGGIISYIVDTTGAFLVDTAGNSIIDTGITFTDIPATVWVQNDGV